MKLHLRNVRPGDESFLESLLSRFSSFGLPPWRSSDEIDACNRRTMHRWLAERDEQRTILVAEDEAGEPLGFIHLRQEADFFSGEPVAYISDIAVAPQAEGKGVAKELMSAADQWAREKRCRFLTLHVFATNRRARGFYEALGFAEESVKYVRDLA